MTNLIFMLMSLPVFSQQLYVEKLGHHYKLEVVDDENVRPLGEGLYTKEVLEHVMISYGFKKPFDFPVAVFGITMSTALVAPLTIAGLSKMTSQSWTLGFEHVGVENLVRAELLAVILSVASLFVPSPLPRIDDLYKMPSKFKHFSEFERDLLIRLNEGCLALYSSPQLQPK